MKQRVVLTLLILIFVSCSGKNVKDAVDANDIKVPSGVTLPLVLKLTGAGINYQPSFSPKGTEIIFVSSDRTSHDNPQIYTMNIEDRSERRVTFQDGKAAHPTFSPDGRRIIYSSTTDESKEDTDFIKNSLERLSGKNSEEKPANSFWQEQPFEIYSSLIDGSRIERLTRSKKYDSETTIDSRDKRMIFISARSGSLNLHMASTTGTYIKALTKTKYVKSHPKYSPDGKWVVWVEYGDEMTSSDIYLSDSLFKKITKITDSQGIHFQPSWHLDGKTLIFSSNRGKSNNFELYSIRSDGNCLQRLTWHSSNDTEPAFSPTESKYLFTSDRSGEKQIYLSDFTPTKTCSEQ